jgi:hypothetical protein
MTKQTEWMTITELAKRYGISRDAFKRYARNPSFPEGRLRQGHGQRPTREYPLHLIEAWLEERNLPDYARQSLEMSRKRFQAIGA